MKVFRRFVVCTLLILASSAYAQNRPVMLTAPPPGDSEFPACCEFCPAGGCTGCNAGPEGLNCGPGLIKAECTMTNNVSTCKKEEAKPPASGPGQLKTRP